MTEEETPQTVINLIKDEEIEATIKSLETLKQEEKPEIITRLYHTAISSETAVSEMLANKLPRKLLKLLSEDPQTPIATTIWNFTLFMLEESVKSSPHAHLAKLPFVQLIELLPGLPDDQKKAIFSALEKLIKTNEEIRDSFLSSQFFASLPTTLCRATETDEIAQYRVLLLRFLSTVLKCVINANGSVRPFEPYKEVLQDIIKTQQGEIKVEAGILSHLIDDYEQQRISGPLDSDDDSTTPKKEDNVSIHSNVVETVEEANIKEIGVQTGDEQDGDIEETNLMKLEDINILQLRNEVDGKDGAGYESLESYIRQIAELTENLEKEKEAHNQTKLELEQCRQAKVVESQQLQLNQNFDEVREILQLIKNDTDYIPRFVCARNFGDVVHLVGDEHAFTREGNRFVKQTSTKDGGRIVVLDIPLAQNGIIKWTFTTPHLDGDVAAGILAGNVGAISPKDPNSILKRKDAAVFRFKFGHCYVRGVQYPSKNKWVYANEVCSIEVNMRDSPRTMTFISGDQPQPTYVTNIPEDARLAFYLTCRYDSFETLSISQLRVPTSFILNPREQIDWNTNVE
ncbi:hypothetical protein BLNAU_9467 [Blattamonas nauphoetae]|uniref:Uncharacterized protein n=1 Tax=Blattamonas nauphoetae TaxID=2049346 RepID=A0ABQ9XVT9_9EUKA|nr:hypothetical protein BLNAU_9467 [Blattamonas nauphoetae]